MVTMTIFDTISTSDWWLWLSGTLTVLFALLFTSYRHVVGYFFAGMLYWLGIEAVSWLVTLITPLSNFHAYLLAVALSLVAIMWFLAVRDEVLPARPSLMRLKPILWLKLFDKRLFTKSLSDDSKAQFWLASPRIAGKKPFVLHQDTDFTQNFIRHTPIFDHD